MVRPWKFLTSFFNGGRRSSQAAVPVDVAPKTETAFSDDLPAKVQDFKLKRWDAVIFAQEAVDSGIGPVAPTKEHGWRVNDGQIQEGTYGGTQLALTEMYDRIERA